MKGFTVSEKQWWKVKKLHIRNTSGKSCSFLFLPSCFGVVYLGGWFYAGVCLGEFQVEQRWPPGSTLGFKRNLRVCFRHLLKFSKGRSISFFLFQQDTGLRMLGESSKLVFGEVTTFVGKGAIITVKLSGKRERALIHPDRVNNGYSTCSQRQHFYNSLVLIDY